jgi:hypothetical protein
LSARGGTKRSGSNSLGLSQNRVWRWSTQEEIVMNEPRGILVPAISSSATAYRENTCTGG